YSDQRRFDLDGTEFYNESEYLSEQYPITSTAVIWSLGVIFYFLTYRNALSIGSSYPLPDLPPTHSPLVQNIVQSCLQKNPNGRSTNQWLAQYPLTNSNAII
ncbi:unnamed protein product, partial [Didymodactylos carnosus]